MGKEYQTTPDEEAFFAALDTALTAARKSTSYTVTRMANGALSVSSYSDGFTENMQHMLELLEKGADVEMTVSGDEICKACPNLKHGVCLSADLVEHYDRKVLEYCGLKERENLSFRDFVDNVQKNIIETGKRVEICGGCQWNEICSRKESRWK